jgi:elongator complex protein 2
VQDTAPAASNDGDCDALALLSPDHDGEDAAALLRGIVRLSVAGDGGSIPLDCTLEARLTEHSAAVLSVVFSDDIASPVLLTAAMDGSVALWRADPQSGRWDSLARFGLLGGAGTHTVGFCGAVFASRGSNHVLAHTLGGAMHAWRAESTPSARSSNHEQTRSTITFAQYMAESAPGGHISTVNSLAWAPSGRFLMSCGEDKTTRIFLQPAEQAGFVEWSRPQVHGHPIRDIAFVNCSGNAFVSASEEKVLRVFDAPSQFVLPSANSELRCNDSMVPHSTPLPSHVAALSASVPELGLSNKPVYAEGKHTDQPITHPPGNLDLRASTETSQLECRPWKSSTVNEVSSVISFGSKRSVGSMPLEGELRQHCLWPERVKLYGHGNELSCVTAETSAGIIASASRAQTARDAVIILWDAITGVEMTRLAAHDLTVNQLRFSPDGRALLSVSRDRSFSVFHRKFSSEDRASLFQFELKTRRLEAHARLINAGCWLLGSNVVATGSRDKFVKLFDFDEASAEGHSLIESSATTEVRSQKFPSGVSALDSWDFPGSHSQVLAIGLDNGSVIIAGVYRLTTVESADVLLTQLLHIPSVLQCSDRVAAIAWRPEMYSDVLSADLQLAVGSDDHVVRIYSVPKVLVSCKSPEQSTEFRF